MSYNNDKEKMNQEIEDRKRLVWTIIKITFIAFAVVLVIFAVVLTVTLITGAGKSGDDMPPEISGRDGGRVVGYVGESPKFKQMVKVVDDSDPAPQLQIDNSKVNINEEGEYKVYYRAIDESGNVSEIYTLVYVVKSKEYSEDTLMSLIAEKAEDLGITDSMSDTEKVRAIYKYVNSSSTIEFTDESNIPNIKRTNWQIDWIEEAIRALDSEEGDCYSYYSLSKAFFEYFGIENIGVKRADSSEEPGTHFWSVVKVEEGWYYYDATRLAGEFSDGTTNACLITQAKLDSYRTSKGGKEFYKMGKVGSIVISTKELKD